MNRALQLIVSLAVMASTLHAQAPTADNPAPGALVVRSSGRTVVLSPSDLARLTRTSLRMPSEVTGDSTTVAGIRLWDVLQRAGVPAAEASGRQRAVMSVILRGRDGQRAVVALVEVDPSFSAQVILLAESRDGRPLDAVEGFWRAIVGTDRRHARWIRDVVDIEITSLR